MILFIFCSGRDPGHKVLIVPDDNESAHLISTFYC